jgi:hypothetical protein
LFSQIVIMAAYAWLIKTEDHKNIAWLVLAFLAGLFIYVPGLVWWLAAAIILGRRKLSSAIAEIPTWVIALGAALFTAMLVPAAISITKDWHVLEDFALIPRHFAPPLEIVKRIGWMISALAVKTPYHSLLIIGRVPFLDIIQLALLAFGAYAMSVAARGKSLALVATIAFATIVAALNANLYLLALGLPAIAVFMAAGLRYLYIEWRGIFPRNPIPKSLALALMIALVSVQCIYGLSYGLLAWPHAPSTKTAYVLK